MTEDDELEARLLVRAKRAQHQRNGRDGKPYFHRQHSFNSTNRTNSALGWVSLWLWCYSFPVLQRPGGLSHDQLG